MRRLRLAMLGCSVFALSCGGAGSSPPKQPETPPVSTTPPSQEVAEAQKPCAPGDQPREHELNDADGTEHLTPCASGGDHKDFSGLIKIENVPNGIHIIIHAKDDEVSLLGPDVKSKDAVIVYPKGPGTKEAIEVPLVQTRDGWEGDRIVTFDQLDELDHDGAKIDVAIFDHDKSSGKSSEELHVSLTVSVGMSCEKAESTYPQDDAKPGPPDDKIQAPMNSAAYMQAIGGCRLPQTSQAKVCAFVKSGRVVGATVDLDPPNNPVAVCMDRATRALAFPTFGPEFDQVAEVTWKAK